MILPGTKDDGDQKSLPAARKPREPETTKPIPAQTRSSTMPAGLRFAAAVPSNAETVKPKREPKAKPKNDPRLVAAARELRDRWLEQVNSTPPTIQGKYEVSRQIAETIEVGPSLPKQIEYQESKPVAA